MKVKFKKKSFDVKVLKGVMQTIGLMFQKPKPVLFPVNGRKIDIHTFFCYSMDIYWIKENNVVKMVNAKPFRIYPGTFADYILETPKNFVNANNGDKISIIES